MVDISRPLMASRPSPEIPGVLFLSRHRASRRFMFPCGRKHHCRVQMQGTRLVCVLSQALFSCVLVSSPRFRHCSGICDVWEGEVPSRAWYAHRSNLLLRCYFGPHLNISLPSPPRAYTATLRLHSRVPQNGNLPNELFQSQSVVN